MHRQQIIAAHPDVRGIVDKTLIGAIDEMYACAQACTSCADGCLAELRQCIRLNLDCADVCAATATLANRRTGSDEEVTGTGASSRRVSQYRVEGRRSPGRRRPSCNARMRVGEARVLAVLTCDHDEPISKPIRHTRR